MARVEPESGSFHVAEGSRHGGDGPGKSERGCTMRNNPFRGKRSHQHLRPRVGFKNEKTTHIQRYCSDISEKETL